MLLAKNPIMEKMPINNTGCGSCNQPFVGFLNPQKKLGKCVLCMALSLVGTVISWSFYFSFLLLGHGKQSDFVAIDLYVSLFFTGLLSAHGIAFLIRKKKERGK